MIRLHDDHDGTPFYVNPKLVTMVDFNPALRKTFVYLAGREKPESVMETAEQVAAAINAQN